MAELTKRTVDPEGAPTFSVVTVPEQLRDQVQHYVNQLVESEADTSAYMLGLGGANFTCTNAYWFKTDESNTDMSCGDMA